MKDYMSYIGHKKDHLCEILLVLGRGGVRVSSLCSLLGCLFPVGSFMPKCKILCQMFKPTDYEKKVEIWIFLMKMMYLRSPIKSFFLNIPISTNLAT